jgi:uncharacterized protein YndB with AHSA1/START domain
VLGGSRTEAPTADPVFFGEYREIVRPERFVWTFGFEGMPGEPGPETYVFEARSKTTLTSTAEFDTIEQRRGARDGMEEGAAETWDRLTSTESWRDPWR